MNTKRILAFIIDFIITAIINNIPFWIMIMIPLIRGDRLPNSSIILRAIVSTLIAFLYLLLRDLPKSGSVGKMIMKLKIVDSETKEPASIGKRLLRNITWLLSWIDIIVYLAAKKRIGDMIAKTDVVEK
ncbi:MAG: RDD family protein [Treponema sp.]|nr:RDD family protein [Treponema sp.]